MRQVDVDLINLGVCGSAHRQPELVDYIAGREDWDFATLELSVSMMGFEPDEFYQSVSHPANDLAGPNMARPVMCITVCCCFRQLAGRFDGLGTEGRPEEYR